MNLKKAMLICGLLLMFSSQKMFAQGRINWTNDQLMEPSELSATLKSNKNVPLIFSVGPGAIIPNSKDIGIVTEAERPAIQALKDMNFTNYKLLNLPHNIKIDWIDMGYPTSN